jgi:hypothetical protein
MASIDNELAQLENCLQRMLQPNTEVIRQAGTEINQRLKLSSCIASLCHLVRIIKALCTNDLGSINVHFGLLDANLK